MNSDGVPIKSVGMTPEETETYAALVSQVHIYVYMYILIIYIDIMMMV